MDDVRRPYRPVDPAAYAGTARLERGPMLRAAGAQAGLVLLLAAVHDVAGLALFAVATLVNVRVLVQPLLARRRDSPFVVDRPGVFVADDAGGGRLVHWESIAVVVLTDLTTPGSGHRRQAPGVALRLRSHPDVLAIRRPLDDRSLDRALLTKAVARFAPPGVTVTREATPDAAPTAWAVVADVAGRALNRVQPARARPAAPGGEHLVVTATGIGLGAGIRRGRPAASRFFAWDDVAAVVVLDVEEPAGWRRAVGVLPPGAPPAWQATHLADLRVVDGRGLDRRRLEREVSLHAPRVPVVDGPPLRRAKAADVAVLAMRLYRSRRRPAGPHGSRVIRISRRRAGRAFTSSERGSPTSR